MNRDANKLHQRARGVDERAQSVDERMFFFAKDLLSDRLVRIETGGVTHTMAAGNYVKVFPQGKPALLLHLTFRKLLRSLPPGNFVQVHRSFAVNLAHIQWLEGNSLHLSCGAIVQVSCRYRGKVQECLREWVLE